VIPVVSVMTAEEDRTARAIADSIARTKDTTQHKPDSAVGPRRTIDPTRRRDSTPVLLPPEPKRKAPATELIIKLGTALKPGSTYRVTMTGLRNLLDRPGITTRLLIIPKPTPIDSTRKGPDGRPLSPSDSTRKPGTPPAPRDSVKTPVTPPKIPIRPPR
jgi:hypothetical protein